MPDDRSTRMLAVVLGASTFPNAPKLADGRAFYISAADVIDYLRGESGLTLPRHNILSLFDDSRSPSDQLMEIAGFLTRHELELKSEGARAEDLLIYYVGHGMFTRGDQAYCLAIRSTNEINEGATSIRATDLASVIKENAAFLRRYLIFDCCFAASIYKEFQSGALSAARVQIAAEFPERGTALLCSSNAREPSLAPHGLERTMFSNALLEALRNGHPAAGRLLSFSELGDLIKENLRTEYPESWVRPEVHSPDQREGDIASIPLFPNHAYGQLELEEKLRQEAAEREAAAKRIAEDRAAAEQEAAKKAAARRKVEEERAARERFEQEQLAREAAEAKRIAEERAAAEQEAAKEAAARRKVEEERAARERSEQEQLAREAAEAKRIAEERAAAELKTAKEAAARRKVEEERAAREHAEQERLAREAAEAKRATVEVNPAERQTATSATPTGVRLRTKRWILALVCLGLLVLTIWWARGTHQPDHKGSSPISSELSDGTSQADSGKRSAPSSPPGQDIPQQLDKMQSAAEASQEKSSAQFDKVLPGENSDLASRFTVGGPDSAQTILDTKSGLMWARKDYWDISGRYLSSWDEAMQFAATSNAESYAGYTDWHVPSVAEYRTINTSKTDRQVAAHIFEKTDALIYWASNTPGPYVASYVGFEIKDGGYAVSGSRTEHHFADGSIMPMSVRLVRRAK